MRKLLLINLLAFAGFFAVSETAASLLQSQQGEPLALLRLVERLRLRAAPLQQFMDTCPVSTVWNPESPFHSDPLLGYWHRPNVSVSSTIRLRRPIKREGIVGKVDRYTWQLSTGAHGERLSQPHSAPELSQGRPTVLLLGDSFIFGSGLPDSLSFGWQLQASLPDRRIVNYAGGGFGTIHQVLLLRDARGQGRLIPASLAHALRGGDVLLGYADFYQLRNVAAPSRLRTFQPRCGALQPPAAEAKSFTHPRAILQHGDLQIGSVPLFQAHSGPDPSKAEQAAVTIALLDEALALVQELGARPTILWVRGNADSAPIQHLRRRGVPILDLRPPGKGLWTHDTLAPFDHHPGPLTANSWAREVAARLAKPPSWLHADD